MFTAYFEKCHLGSLCLLNFTFQQTIIIAGRFRGVRQTKHRINQNCA